MSVETVVEGLDGTKGKLAQAPHEEVAAGLAGLKILGIGSVQESIEAALARLRSVTEGAAAIKQTGTTCAEEATTIADTGTGTTPRLIREAAGNIENMGDKAEQVGTGSGEMTANLQAALGHLAAFEACMDRHGAMTEEAQKDIVESATARVVAIEQITAYQQEISGLA